MTSQIQYYVRKIKQRYISLAERNKIHYQLGKLIEQGECVPISVKATRGARRTYNYYKGFEQETTWTDTRPRDLASMNQTQFNNLLMGHSEFSRGNVLDMLLDDLAAPPQYDDISHDLNISFDLETVRTRPVSHETDRTTSTSLDIDQNTTESAGMEQNSTEQSGLPRNIPEL